jgi:hypothetical protein
MAPIPPEISIPASSFLSSTRSFHLALHSLKEEKEDAEAREEKLRQQQQEQMEERRKETEARRLEQSRAEDERRKREEENRRQPRGSDDRFRKAPQQSPPQASRTSRQPAKRPPTPPPSFYNRASNIFAAIQAMIANTAHQMTSNPMAFFRTIMFLLVFATAFGRRDLRERIMRILRNAWDKIRRTVGMGVKVSYI